MNDGDGRRDLSLQLLQELDELFLSLAIGGVSVDLAMRVSNPANRFKAPQRSYSCSTRTG